MALSSNRRLEDRIAFRVPAHILVGPDEDMIRGYVLNLSDWGVFVIMDQEAELDGEIQMDFQIAPGVSCAATGTVAHQVPMGNSVGFGVEFTERNMGYANFIRNLEGADDGSVLKMIGDMKRVDVRVAS